MQTLTEAELRDGIIYGDNLTIMSKKSPTSKVVR